MKTGKFRLMVTMVALAAVNMLTITNAVSQEKFRREKIDQKIYTGEKENTRKEKQVNNDSGTGNSEYTKNKSVGGTPDRQYSNGSANLHEKNSGNYSGSNRAGSKEYSGKREKESYKTQGNINSKEKDYKKNPDDHFKGYGSRENDRKFEARELGKFNLYRDYRKSKYYFHHPRYGHTVRLFEHSPLVFNYTRGRLFFSEGCFFEYRPGIGYIAVDFPYHLLFTSLPYNAVSVGFRGKIYMSAGALFFEPHRGGFRLVPLNHDVYHHFYPGQVYYSSRF